MTTNETVDEAKARYTAALHAMQSGVAMKMNFDSKETEPKHLRVGVNSSMIQSSTLVRLMFEKNMVTELEYFTMLADVAEEEANLYQEMIQERYPNSIIALR